VEELVVRLLRESLLSSLDRPLDSSVGTLDGLRDVDAAKLFHTMIEHSVSEYQVPCAREGPDDVGIVGSDGLALRARGAVVPRVLKVSEDLWIVDSGRVRIADPRHPVPPLG
jgi:hypothetical protein